MGIAAIAASTLVFFSSGSALAGVPISAETTNATVEASASATVNAEQNQIVQRQSELQKRQVETRAPSGAQKQ